MPSLAVWTAGPRVGRDDEEGDETAETKFKDLADALIDINGGIDASYQELSSEQSVSRLNAELESIEQSQKTAWMKAQVNCPELVGRDHKLLFLNSESSKDMAVS